MSEMQRQGVLDGEIQLALQIEGNDPGSGWAVELRRSLQRKNDALTALLVAALGGTELPKKVGSEEAGLFFSADRAARLRAAIARVRDADG